VLSLIPSFNFSKIFLDICTLTIGSADVLTSTYTKGPGFYFSSLYTNVSSELLPVYEDGSQPNIPLTYWSLCLLLGNMLFFSLLAWYFDNVIPNEFGQCEKPW
jgi:hypothetical protein